MTRAFFIFLALLSGFAVPAGSHRGYLIFRDDFSGRLDDKWLSYPGATPRLNRSQGKPAPSLDCAGTETTNGGVITKRLFGRGPGLIIGCDLLVMFVSGHSWFGGSFGLIESPRDFSPGRWPRWLVGISFDYLGRLQNPAGLLADEGTLTCTLVDEDGDREIFRRPFRNEYLGDWHCESN